MDCTASRISYKNTGYFNKIVADYLDQSPSLLPFFKHGPDINGITSAIDERKNRLTDRGVLVAELKKQYTGVNEHENVSRNIEVLSFENTFTITTAHQPNIFTGHLYFIYKILHAIRLASDLKQQMPAYNFVPVFYMGSEDADLEELNHIHLGGDKLEWKTRQTGAVGRMKIDKEFLALIDRMEGQLSVLPFGKEIVQLVRVSYRLNETIQSATFRFINELFGEYGLIVLIADTVALKKQMLPVFEDDLFHQTASGIVEKTSERLGKAYKVQAHPREINLFYLKDDIRERITKANSKFKVQNVKLEFDEEEIRRELMQYPDRFSPNVILRGLYQETILPNIAFIGGGGELSYWLQLKELFDHYKVPFPVLVLRNSFMIVEKKWNEKIFKLGFNTDEIFHSEEKLLSGFVSRESKNPTHLNGRLTEANALYENIRKQAASVDKTLEQHVAALQERTLFRLKELEKKMLRAEKRKHNDARQQISHVKQHLFPGNGLQERHDNILYYLARFGKSVLSHLYENSPSLEQQFTVITEK